MRRALMILWRSLLLLSALVVGVAASGSASAQQLPFNKQRVTYANGALALVGYLYKPAGPGPFPTLVWNHGSEQNPGGGPQFDSVAAIFVPAGYAVLAPLRRGHGDSQGDYIQDRIEASFRESGATATERLMVQLMESEQLSDQLAGLSYAKTLAFVDTSRLVVAGCSYGGIQTLLAAERGAGYRAAVAISPAALSWNGNSLLQERLILAAQKTGIPVFLLQPPKDASLEPSRVLGGEFQRLGKSYRGKIYPDDIPAQLQTHCFGGARSGSRIWAQDVLAFLAEVLR